MLDDRNEKILNQLHIVALMIGRAQKHVNMRNHIMAQKYLQDTKDFIGEMMAEIRQKGEVK